MNSLISYLNRQKIRQVHDTVNSAADKQAARVDQLSQTLQQAGVPIPSISQPDAPVVPPPPAAPEGQAG